MGHSQAEKAATRERLLEIAARKVREEGLSQLSVADLMQTAGLTHGGFYRHFPSRSALIRQAVARALAEGEQNMQLVAAHADSDDSFIHAYLSAQHRDFPGSGCALAALGAAIGSGESELKTSYEQQVRKYLNRITGPDEGQGGARDKAILTLSALVGALTLARAVADPELSDEILQTVAQQLTDQPQP